MRSGVLVMIIVVPDRDAAGNGNPVAGLAHQSCATLSSTSPLAGSRRISRSQSGWLAGDTGVVPSTIWQREHERQRDRIDEARPVDDRTLARSIAADPVQPDHGS
jgi:hypothetical protein